MATGFYFDERCLWHSAGEQVLFLPVGGFLQPLATGGAAEAPETKRRLKNLVEVSSLIDHLDRMSAPPLGREDLLRIHPPSYLDRFKALSDGAGGDMGEEAAFGRGGFEIACLSAGLARRGLADVMAGRIENAYVLSRPPGHHCLPDKGMGFCLLANIPLALEALRADVGPVRAAVIDWDVHHGNGTEAIYAGRSDTLTISLHQERCYPVDTGAATDRGTGDGMGANLNIPLLPGGGHQAYLDAFELLVEPAVRKFWPDLIVIACGLDANALDPLARMQAHSGTFREMTRRAKALAGDLCGGRIVAVHEGGYSEAYVPFCGLAVIEELAGHRTEVQDPFAAVIDLQQPATDMVQLQRQRIEVQARALAG